ncbi:hypothetical protein O6H91_06G116500 [Diphasiastrum complanatum]|uniref:Uncharacterized protein n=7 Tax=Diphasiastrum complanatum TaxID=34168 RepID=A0ACC2DI70_DIPCM|nr:hypothetical protein O6H91_06G116200 [Diphasiastrum complanatum]KAJ7553869.1 hypothetical protein O6H91_06G116200 [Diphasiastrum complanatum]KAJ7553870.1 hypothetical protein O6H91_06G116200 [Diphasiastrum complanatum]KAJ7553871.1 hypothetical protein O6H91_06G116200 [Diphasiastrum complanatum]KAJ7553872.1 hypothetical protein O6H91_06G116200 [Diphasiastrum complanatum]
MAMAGQEATNRQIILKHYVKGMVKELDFELRVSKVLLSLHPGTKDVLVKNIYLSPDPYMRSRMQPMEDPYIDPFSPGEVITGYGVSKVLVSNHPEFKPNDYVVGFTGWEEYSVIKEARTLRKIPQIGLPLSYFLGVLGMPGLTAYAGFHKVALPKPGDQLMVSGAAGAVGQLVGQFGKLAGCYVVGAAGSKEKVKLLKERIGYDDAFNYREETDLKAALRRHLPKKIDIYWENVGGKMLEAVLENINKFGRIPACGMISQYNLEKPEGVSNLFRIVAKSVRMQGFLVFDYEDLYEEFTERVSGLLKDEKLVYFEDVSEGLEKAPRALIDLFEGKNIGKKIVKICDPD